MPALRASDSPIAIACLGLVTFLPLLPLFSLPCFMAFISRSTLLPAAGEYLRVALFFAVADFLTVAFLAGAVLAESFLVAGEAFFAVAFFVVVFFADLGATLVVVVMALPPCDFKKHKPMRALHSTALEN